MKKVLIMTASTGGGHNKAALALEKAYVKDGYQVKIVDILKLINSVIENAFIDGYDFLYSSFPWLYRNVYKHSDNRIVRADNTKVIGKIFRSKMLSIIDKEKPCVIVGTHAFSVGIINRLKQRRRIRVPFICVVTDFKAHATYFGKFVDAYITGSEDTCIDMLVKGIPKKRLHSLGIPISEEFWKQDIDKSNKDKPLVMIMGGSLCNLDMIGILKALCDSEKDYDIVAICGSNEEMFIEASSFAKDIDNRNLEILGFTDRVPELMAKSDLLITKPGGLTISEAIVSELPMVIPESLPGQEEDNLTFLLTNNLAYYANDIYQLSNVVEELMTGSDKLDEIKVNLRAIKNGYSMDKIVELSNKLCNKKS